LNDRNGSAKPEAALTAEEARQIILKNLPPIDRENILGAFIVKKHFRKSE